ncbi:hypothetical protein SKAU_G00030920 [Synaphobranchus kaupii]|uniref:Uncharacterized protein n=1 Tax=Synaphobranchus kaupii TaxID=118154 RepID=A0A9Q1GF16_SYNKA|nr:hypothetical protein SKAU_G00030920 [Synaphobranchus kaupii]
MFQCCGGFSRTTTVLSQSTKTPLSCTRRPLRTLAARSQARHRITVVTDHGQVAGRSVVKLSLTGSVICQSEQVQRDGPPNGTVPLTGNNIHMTPWKS